MRYDLTGNCPRGNGLVYFVAGFLLGLQALPEDVIPAEEPSPTQQRLWRDDQMNLRNFAAACARLARLRQATGREGQIIDCEEIDDLAVLAAKRSKKTPCSVGELTPKVTA